MNQIIKREPASLKRETAYLLLEFNKVDTEKKSPFWEKWDKKIQNIEQKMSTTDRAIGKQIIKDWRYDDSIPTDLYLYLRRNYPFPIPHVLFFPFKNKFGYSYNCKNMRKLGDLADKWLKDIFSRESFYKRNKEYFTRAEVKYFLSCDWQESTGGYYDIFESFINAKIIANNISLYINTFKIFHDCFTHKIVIEHFKFLSDNREYVNDKETEEVNKILKNEYILTGKNIDFKNQTYERLYDEVHFSNILRERFEHRYEHKIVQDYFTFICKKIKRSREKEEGIRDICDFLVAQINNEQDFDFKNMTWQKLKRLSDKWSYVSNMTRNRMVYFYHRITQYYIIFICKKVKRVRDKEEEIMDICDFLNNRINNEQYFSFDNMTWQELKRLSDEWYVLNMFRNRIENFDHEIVQGYFTFIRKKIKRIREKEEEIRDIYDFLENEYIDNGRDFDFENMTWQELKRLSDEWHLENRWARDPYSRNYFKTKWKKSSIKNFSYEKDGKTWTIMEITTGRALHEEGEKMHHCVSFYADSCIRGGRIIFSVRYKIGENGSEKKIATVEISGEMKLVQARGPCNASVGNETAEIIKIWAGENKIDCGNYLSNR